MIGTRIGTLNGIEVRKPSKNDWILYDTSEDECFYWFGNDLYYKGISVAYVDGIGNVKDFKEDLFRQLQGVKEEEKEKEEVAESQPEEYEASYEAPIGEESASIEEMFRQSRGSVEDLLNGFDLVADRYLEEEGKRAV